MGALSSAIDEFYGTERHRAILCTAMDGVCLVDTQGRLLEVNEAYCRMSGYRFSEWYGCGDTPDQGLRITDQEIGQGILDREKKLGISNRKSIIRLAGPDCWNKKPDYKGGGQGPSTAETFASMGLFFSKGDPGRVQKIQQFRERLRVPRDSSGKQTDRPMLQVYDTCKHFLSTIPALSMDENNPEDIDTDQEDHIYDEACHFVMAKPVRLEIPPPIRSLADIRIDHLEKKRPINPYEDYALRDHAIDQRFWRHVQGGPRGEPVKEARKGRCYSDIDGR